jgi:hypothetical protein
VDHRGAQQHYRSWARTCPTDGDAYGDENETARVSFFTGMGAVSYEHRFSDRTYGN